MTDSNSMVQCALQLGGLTLYPPLSVRTERHGKDWLALLEPGERTGYEYGAGETPEEALEDLAIVVREVLQHLTETPASQLGKDMLQYRDLLRRYAIPNSTCLVYGDSTVASNGA